MQSKLKYQDASLPIEQRVDDLIYEMTIEEKVAQLAAVWSSDLMDSDRQFISAKAEQAIPHGIGHITRIGAVSMLPPVQSAELANRIQRYLREETRLGIPAIVHEESCAGYVARDATTFPQAIGQAATWNPELVQEAATFIRQQMRAVGAHHTLAPVLDVARDPRWGRVEETFGEDPYLISAIGNAYIRGIQGDDWQKGIVATAKHFIGYGFSEGGLNWAPAHIPKRLLREIYLTPFAAAIHDAKVASVMNAYQELDGVPAGSDQSIMVDLLRDELGFEGVVVADYFTINMFVNYHKIASTKSEAARFGLQAGIDVELPGVDCYGQPLLDALASGDIEIDLVDAAVRRLLDMKLRLGLFENPYVEVGTVPSIYTDPNPVTLSQKIAEDSIVLLKNNGILPLTQEEKTIAVIGAAADSARLLQGDYHYPAHMEGIVNLTDENMDAPAPGEDNVTVTWEEHRPPTVTILEGLGLLGGDTITLNYERGCDINSTDTSGFEAAIQTAEAADVAIFVAGDMSGLGLGCTSGEAIDRATLELPGVQEQLLQRVIATGTPVVLVLTNGRPPALSAVVEGAAAIVEAWLPAEQGGTAVANVLFGMKNPGGKLPISFPRHVGQVPVYYNHKPSGQRSHWHGVYADMETTPLFAFGHGLSYTQFDYTDLRISHPEARAEDTIAVTLIVTNSGDRAGDEVVQLYIGDPIASVTRPVKMLKGFKRVHLQPGEATELIFHLPVAHFAFYDRQMRYVVEPGQAKIMVGSASDDIRLEGEFNIIGETTCVQQVYTTLVD